MFSLVLGSSLSHAAEGSVFISGETSALIQSKPGGSWAAPNCDRVSGTSWVTFTVDDGATLAPTSGLLRITGYTYGLAALPDVPNTIDAVFNRTFIRSTTAGCRWMTVGTIPTVSDGFPVTLTAAAGDRAWAWSDNRPDLVRLDGTSMTQLQAPVGSIIGFGSDRSNGAVARLGGNDGSLWETTDAGEGRWTYLGTAPTGQFPLVYRAAFDPADLGHAIVGMVGGAQVTFDGGRNWTAAQGFSSTGDGPVNVFNAVIAEANGNVVWAMALDIAELDGGAPSGGRHIYRSVDGGLHFVPVVDASADVTIINGPTMAAPPNSADVLYFTFGSRFAGYGTDLYKFDATTGQVTKTHNDNHRMPAIEFNPADPSVLYLGIGHEIGS
jgi:hypothetical protein